MVNKEILEFEVIKDRYNYNQLVDIGLKILEIHKCNSALMLEEFDIPKKLELIQEQMILEANHKIVLMAISYKEMQAVKETKFGTLSLN